MAMRALVARFLVTGGLALMVGCSPTMSEVSGPVPLEFQLDPCCGVTVVAGGSTQIRARNIATGQPVEVAWRLSDSQFGTITPAGILSVSKCPGPAATSLTALLQADTTFTATTQLTRIDLATARLSIAGIRYVPSGLPARIDSLAGTLDLSVDLDPTGCGDLSELQVHLLQDGTDVTVATMPIPSVSPPGLVTLVLRWDADALANGEYRLGVVATGPEGQRIDTPTNPITIRH